MHRIVAGSGPQNARIMVIGEAPGYEEERTLLPFNGQSGTEFGRMLNEAGINRNACYFTYVCKHRPPTNDVDDLIWTKKSRAPEGFVPLYNYTVHTSIAEGAAVVWAEIDKVKPDMIITCGNLPLWVLSQGEATSAVNWRGSQLRTYNGYRYVPTYSPTTVLRQWSWRSVSVTDIRRARMWMELNTPDPEYRFIVRPGFDIVMQTLDELIRKADVADLPLAVDIETRANQIACIGIAWSTLDAICIPLMCVESDEGYWSLEEELIITKKVQQLLQHKRVRNSGQNFIYDSQFFWRQYHYVPRLAEDTMVMQHVAFAGMQKGLDFLSSMYCRFHRFWKEEGKLWDPRTTNENQLWVYNCKDAVITFEITEALGNVLKQLNLWEQYRFQMDEFWWSILLMTLRGVRVDSTNRGQLAMELMETNTELTRRIQYIVGRPINIKSPKQLQELFYSDLNLAPIKDRKTGRISTNFESIKKLADKEPLVWPISDILLTLRSIGVFVSTFLSSQLDVDGRMRCSYNVAGPETYRLASSQNPFGSGMNMQNIPSGDRKKLLVKMPNVRNTFIPDPGYTIFDIDLDRADLQVVVWEADDIDLKRQLRLGVDLHVMNGILLAGKEPPPEDELIESHPNYAEHKARYKAERQLAKNFVHGCVDEHHEVLTPLGWKSVAEASQSCDQILVTNADGTGARFEQPKDWYVNHVTTTMHRLTGAAYDQFVTWDHTMPYTVTSGKTTSVTQAFDLPASARCLKTCEYSGTLADNPMFGRLLSAFHADGSIAGNKVRFHLKKERKILMLLFIGAALGTIPDVVKYDDGTVNVVFSGAVAQKLIRSGKQPTFALLQYSGEFIDAYLDELTFWDGAVSATNETFHTSNAHTAEVVQTLLHLRGQSGSILEANGKYRVQINNRPYARITNESKSNWTGTVYCPVTSTGFWFTRRNGRMAVTGNTNYGGKEKTMAAVCGITVAACAALQKRWFSIHPGIKKWHDRVEQNLQRHRFVSNAFGYRRYYFDRIDTILPEALAWIPQSTVANVTSRMQTNVDTNVPDVHLLIQVHDSLVGQYITRIESSVLPKLHKACLITVPYPDPLIIPVGLKTSTKSWGMCEEAKWPADVSLIG